MTREHGPGRSGAIRVLVAMLVAAGLLGLSALTASAQEVPPVDVPTPLEACQEALPEGVGVSDAVAEALAERDLPPELVEQILGFASRFDLTCEDLFGGGDDA